ncbi:hypothetical protein QYF52_09505 [Paenibacillus polymyxa]|uniref:hypothetical protein n=2 Tax=Paenibacillus TaxID=44249 RepID=UPI0025B6F39C|nr:hypothetical protein [Paenibacillus polymyxa]MDN4078171.1 hypothetical protein [Paenibacillus polymyxa]MDN4103592.1 hypothetical protein [Paenibacillus polymyxa]
MKRRFVCTGQVPDESELLEELPDIDQVELDEGMAEFRLILGNWPIAGSMSSCSYDA